MNTSGNWYVGSAGSIDSWRVDLWSVVTHESGHAWGHINHFPPGSADCGAETMCEVIYLGTTWVRSPFLHDGQHANSVY